MGEVSADDRDWGGKIQGIEKYEGAGDRSYLARQNFFCPLFFPVEGDHAPGQSQ